MYTSLKTLLTLTIILSSQFLQASRKEGFRLDLAPKQWQKFGEIKDLDDDIVVLKDGNVISGKLEEIQEISYSFASIKFDIKEIAAISYSQDLSPKIHYVTVSGENYTGDIPNKAFKFLKKTLTSTISNTFWGEREEIKTEYLPIQLEHNSIDFILRKRKKWESPLTHKTFYSIQLKNGDRFPFILQNSEIHLEKGNQPFSISTKDIRKITQIGDGIRGYIIKEGIDTKLHFSLLKDQFFTIRLARNKQILHIPWKEIHQIRNDQGKMLLETPYLTKPDSLKKIKNMVFIPGGQFFLGTNNKNLDNHQLPLLKSTSYFTKETTAQILMKKTSLPSLDSPAQMIYVPSFYIDKYEVTNEEYLQFVKETGHRKPAHWPGGYMPPNKRKHPVTNISFKDALAYCLWAGKRLATEIEWERAAKGSTSFPYPYGPYYNPVMNNVESSSTVPVGSYEFLKEKQSTYPIPFMPKAQDMSGNVREWTSSSYSLYWYSELEKKGISWNAQKRTKSPYRVIKGGSYKSSSEMSKTTYRTSMHEDDFNDYTGFRCVLDKAPKS